MNCLITLCPTVMCACAAGCQGYDRYSIQIRDESSLPVSQARVSVSYGLELDRWISWFKPDLKPSNAVTNADGCATLKIARDEDWMLVISSPEQDDVQAPHYIVKFHPPATPDHRGGTVEIRDGWLVSRNLMTEEAGPLVRVAPLR